MAGSSKRKRSLADLDRARRVGRTFYDVVVGEGDLAGLSAAVEKADTILSATKIAALEDEKRADAVERAQVLYDEALAALEAHRERIWFRALPEHEYNALRLKHPMPDAVDGADAGEMWSFVPALVAVCAIDFDATADEWAETLKGWPRADKDLLVDAVVRANTQGDSLILGKG